MEATVRFAASELAEGRLASSSVMARLSETLLIEAVRRYSSGLEEQEAGWLKGLKDPYIGRALALIHQKLSAPWSAEALASEVASSRSAFVQRFTSLVGMPPIRYLTVWRLQTAKLNLRRRAKLLPSSPIPSAMESEEAFSRAFKRKFGLAPAQWRQGHSAE